MTDQETNTPTMGEPSTSELPPALHSLKDQFEHAIGRELQRRKRRRKTIRTGILSLGALLVLSGSALAAGDAIGVIDLGGGESAAPVSIKPVFDPNAPGAIEGFVTGKPGAPYTYHLTGGESFGIGPCGLPGEPSESEEPGPPKPGYKYAPNNIYVEATHPLTREELQEIIRDQSAGTHRPRVASDYPGVTNISNGCPTPGIGGEPAVPRSRTSPTPTPETSGTGEGG